MKGREKERDKDNLLNKLNGACISQLQEILSLTCPAVGNECKAGGEGGGRGDRDGEDM